jgi:outer membrane receptor protein involved in Fe transport
MRGRELVCVLILLGGLVLTAAAPVAAQINTVDLSGQILDPQKAAVPDAKITVKNAATGATRTAETNDQGRYMLVGLPPGRYEFRVEATGFAKVVNPEVVLTIGQSAELNVTLTIQTGTETVQVTEATELIEVRRTAVASTVDQRRIESLPINGRNYINFTLTNSQAQRDSAPSIGAAPTSGLNFQGQRARSNQVSVDGADAVDNSTNGIRATVSQEAVQEFQLIMSNYMPEFGRATGGVVNIVTKGGSNAVHGNIFGYLRHKSIQARNPFSVEVDPVTFAVRGVKQGYTRVQAGATLGGPIKKDKTFYFFSFETTRRQETGFTNIGSGNFGLVPATTPAVPGVTLLLTPAQRDFVNNLSVLTAPSPGPGQPTGAQRAAQLFLLAGSASNVALNGVDPGLAATVLFALPTAAGARFVVPIDCSPGTCAAANLVPLPASFAPLRTLIGNYPVSEGTSMWSARIDHRWNQQNNSFVRVSVTPSLVTGIQVNAQNQNFGQNAGSRTSLQQTRDLAVVGQHVTSFTNTLFNEFRFQFARRGLHYGFSQLPGGDQAGINITGYAFFGREPFSTVDRIERRLQWIDNVSWIKGNHSFKVGADVNFIQLRSKKEQIFELNFGGVYNFGGLTAGQFSFPSSVGGVASPGMTAVQAYGFGAPQVFIQGIGNSNKPFGNKTFALFAQDSWRVTPRVTLNYGVRYDLELTPVFEAATAINRAAETAFDLVEGIPVDKNNVAPRFALAWDPKGNGKTVVRMGYGWFFDHPLLAVAFDSIIGEGALSTQLLSGGGSATRTPVAVNPTGAMNAGSIFQGVLNTTGLPTLGYLPGQQRFDAKLPNSLFANQNFLTAGFPLPLLPFTLHVHKKFEYGYAQQGNLTIEQSLFNDYRVSVSYTYTHALKLNRPRNSNPPNAVLLSRNYRNALVAGLTPSSPVSVAAPTSNIAATAASCGVVVSGLPGLVPGVLGVLSGCPASLAALNGQFLSTPAFFNMFRPSGPNPSFAGLAGGYANQVALAQAAGYPKGLGVPVPFSDIMQQESSGNSIYHGLTVSVQKRFSRHFEFLSAWTWSHALDDSTDLQTLLAPQDNRNPQLERGNSSFDQRHRWVSSAVFQSPWKSRDAGFVNKVLGDFTVAPIFDVASGRPFTVLTGSDFNLDFGSNTDRPSVTDTGGVESPFLPGVHFTIPTTCDATVTLGTTSISPPFGCTGNLGRNTFARPSYFTVDLRVSRKIWFTEKWNLEVIADMFNLLNRFNVADVSPLCNPLDPATCRAGEPTAVLDPRQFQFALKINW